MAVEASKAQQGTEGGQGNVVKYCYQTLATGVPLQVVFEGDLPLRLPLSKDNGNYAAMCACGDNPL